MGRFLSSKVSLKNDLDKLERIPPKGIGKYVESKVTFNADVKVTLLANSKIHAFTISNCWMRGKSNGQVNSRARLRCVFCWLAARRLRR